MSTPSRMVDGVQVSLDRLVVRLTAFLTAQGIASNRAAWVTAVNAMTQAQLNAATRILLIELPVFQGANETDPVAGSL